MCVCVCVCVCGVQGAINFGQSRCTCGANADKKGPWKCLYLPRWLNDRIRRKGCWQNRRNEVKLQRALPATQELPCMYMCVSFQSICFGLFKRAPRLDSNHRTQTCMSVADPNQEYARTRTHCEVPITIAQQAKVTCMLEQHKCFKPIIACSTFPLPFLPLPHSFAGAAAIHVSPHQCAQGQA
jgi:hypothetical protein